jgi:hypothetical protein
MIGEPRVEQLRNVPQYAGAQVARQQGVHYLWANGFGERLEHPGLLFKVLFVRDGERTASMPPRWRRDPSTSSGRFMRSGRSCPPTALRRLLVVFHMRGWRAPAGHVLIALPL